jgi:hypothetical protein
MYIYDWIFLNVSINIKILGWEWLEFVLKWTWNNSQAFVVFVDSEEASAQSLGLKIVRSFSALYGDKNTMKTKVCKNIL